MGFSIRSYKLIWLYSFSFPPMMNYKKHTEDASKVDYKPYQHGK